MGRDVWGGMCGEGCVGKVCREGCGEGCVGRGVWGGMCGEGCVGRDVWGGVCGEGCGCGMVGMLDRDIQNLE